MRLPSSLLQFFLTVAFQSQKTYFVFQNMSQGWQVFKSFSRVQNIHPLPPPPPSHAELSSPPSTLDMPVDETTTGNVMDSCSAGHSQAVILPIIPIPLWISQALLPTVMLSHSLILERIIAVLTSIKLSGKPLCSQSATRAFRYGLMKKKRRLKYVSVCDANASKVI